MTGTERASRSRSTQTVAGAGFTSLFCRSDGAFSAVVPAAGTYTFTYKAKNSQGTQSASAATVTLTFPAGNGPAIKVVDGKTKSRSPKRFRWIIEEDRTFYVDPTTTTTTAARHDDLSNLRSHFHTSYMPVLGAGLRWTDRLEAARVFRACCRCATPPLAFCSPGAQKTAVDPSQVIWIPQSATTSRSARRRR